MLCLSGFEQYFHWMPLKTIKKATTFRCKLRNVIIIKSRNGYVNSSKACTRVRKPKGNSHSNSLAPVDFVFPYGTAFHGPYNHA